MVSMNSVPTVFVKNRAPFVNRYHSDIGHSVEVVAVEDVVFAIYPGEDFTAVIFEIIQFFDDFVYQAAFFSAGPVQLS